MSLHIRGQGGHLGFENTPKSSNTSSEAIEEHFWQVASQDPDLLRHLRHVLKNYCMPRPVNKGRYQILLLMTTSRDLACRAFNIFQFYQYCLYFTIYRWYFLLKFEQFHEYLIQHSLKSGGTVNTILYEIILSRILFKHYQ
jgi:hypothetical protein